MANEILELLRRIDQRLAQAKPVLNFDEAVAYLGVSSSYLYKLTSSNEIPHSKPGGKLVYFERTTLDRWAMRRPIQSRAQIEQSATNHVNHHQLRR